MRRSGAAWLVLAAAAAAVAGGGFLVQSRATYGLGLPLDDAWIHQTYARNLVERGEWAFQPGEPSAGSTAPLWTLALAVGCLLKVAPLGWAYAVGIVLLALVAWATGRWFEQRPPGLAHWRAAAIVLVAFEWHLVWSGVSGMEMPAVALLAVLVFSLLEAREANGLVIGALLGIGVWLRPDALLLAIPVVLVEMGAVLREGRRALFRLGLTVGAAALLVGAYLAANRWISGDPWPTTFYAKQAEYAVLRERPIGVRLVEQLRAPLVGMGVVLLPGAVGAVVRDLRQRCWARLAAPLWVGMHLSAYALRLPVTYQHGRYAMPVIPVVLLLGFDGLAGWAQVRAQGHLRRVVSRVWVASVVAVTAGFYLLGARAYAQDVAIIESEMVATARWIASETEPDALVAAHDIGALGYFGQRRLIDLAGLVSPEVVPILRDESALARYLDERQADYLMTFPGWYPRLVEQADLVYTTAGTFSPAAGGENMAVYRWRAVPIARAAWAVLYSP